MNRDLMAQPMFRDWLARLRRSQSRMIPSNPLEISAEEVWVDDRLHYGGAWLVVTKVGWAEGAIRIEVDLHGRSVTYQFLPFEAVVVDRVEDRTHG